MVRIARQKSMSNIYHVMVRGINRKDIFLGNADRNRFLKLLHECKEISGCKIYAYCLMSNHVHLLLRPEGESLELFMKRLEVRYAVWFNRKHGRNGHLFQNRFKSENVEDEQYFMTVLRYIIQNPMKAGMEKEPGHYPWSSYRAYAHGQGGITDVGFATKLAGGRENLLKFFATASLENALDIPDEIHMLDDETAGQIFLEVTGFHSPTKFQKLPRTAQWWYFFELFNRGLSVSQIAALSGRPKSTVSDAIKRKGVGRGSAR